MLAAKPVSRLTERGSILIIVLWSVFFLSVLAMAIDAHIRPQLALGGKLLRRTWAHYLAESGVRQAILAIEKDTTPLHDGLTDTWADVDGKELGMGAFTVELVDEERKININKAPYRVLKDFIEIAGETDSQEAEDIADSIMDWRDEDDDSRENGAEDGYYSMLHPGYPCKNKDFEAPEELLLVKGVTRELFDKIRDRITIYTEGPVNINTADTVVLVSIGMTGELAGKILDFRKESVFEDMDVIASTLAETEDLSGDEISRLNKIFALGLFSVRSDNFMGQSVGELTGGTPESRRITFVFNREERKIKYWREG